MSLSSHSDLSRTAGVLNSLYLYTEYHLHSDFFRRRRGWPPFRAL